MNPNLRRKEISPVAEDLAEKEEIPAGKTIGRPSWLHHGGFSFWEELMSSKNNPNGIMSARQAERIIEIFENGSKNGQEWAHDVCLHRGTEKYEASINTLNEAFRLKSINIVVKPLKISHMTPVRKRSR
jgi:hypothetical protein